MKRCIIFFFYDKDGIVDKYIFHILEDLKKRSERIIFVCNGKLAPQSRNELGVYTEDILVRENTGYDVWAYKEGLAYCGWNHLKQYDELVMMNHTIFPTPHSFSNMFDHMDSISADFWGVTKFFESNTTLGRVPDHIQSHFIAVRHEMLSSYEFKTYWENMPQINSYAESVKFHESKFTELFKEYGFKPYVYVETEELRPLTNCPAYWHQRYLLRNTSTPLIKRKSFYYQPYDGLMFESSGEAVVESFRALKENSEFNTEMIWENILRTGNMTDIKNALHLNYVFPHEKVLSETKSIPKVAVIIYVQTHSHLELFEEYFHSIPKNADIYILSPLDNVKPLLQLFQTKGRIQFNKTENGIQPSAAVIHFLLNHKLTYEYILVLSLNITNRKDYAATYKSMECLLKSHAYVQNILYKFEEEPSLGLLFPSPPINSTYTSRTGREWIDFKAEVTALCMEQGIPFDESAAPIAPYFGMYWCRAEAINRIIDLYRHTDAKKWENEERGLYEFWNIAIGLMAQKSGYYSGWVYNTDYAAIEITNVYFYLYKFLKQVTEDKTIWEMENQNRNKENSLLLKLKKIAKKLCRRF